MKYDFSRLKGRMVECGYSQVTLAKAIGISPATLSLKLNGKRDFTLTEMRTIVTVLHITNGDYYFFDPELKKS